MPAVAGTATRVRTAGTRPAREPHHARDELWMTVAREADDDVSDSASRCRPVSPGTSPAPARPCGSATPIGTVFAVFQLVNRADGKPFDDADRRFTELPQPIGMMLETWWRMTRLRRLG